MGGSKTIQKNFNAFRGKDIASSDLVRSPESAIEIQNAMFSKGMDLINRRGSKILGPNGQFLGAWNHSYSNLTTGAVVEEVLSISDRLYRLTANTFVVAYAGAATVCQLNIYLVPGTTNAFKIILLEGTTTVLTFSLGTGLEAVPITLANAKTAIDAVAGFSATITGSTATPAALVLPTSINLDLASAPKSQTITWYSWTAINETNSNTFATYYAARGNTDFEHASGVNASNAFMIATGYEYLMHYEGQTVYRLGVPEPTTPTLALGGAGGPTGTYTYILTYVQIDNRGNRIEGTESVISGSVAPANQIVNVTVPNILAGSGFNTNYAQVNGAQVGVNTITVNNPHTIKVGDTAYFLDGVSGAYVTRAVSAVTATTITVGGAAVNVANNAAISNNLRIAIYRNKNGGIDYFLVAEIPNNSGAATQVYADTKVDASLGLQYQFATDGREHDLLSVKPRYLCVHQNQLIAAGDFGNPDTVYFSLPADPWHFSSTAGFGDIISTRAGGLSGLASDGTFLVAGKEFELFIGSGDFSEPGAYRFERLNQPVGFACHNAIQQIDDGIMFPSLIGFYRLRGGSVLEEIGVPINRTFTEPVYTDSQRMQLKRSWAQYWDAEKLYVCFVPCESGSGTGRYANSNSLIFTYDTNFDGWIDWNSLNMGGGILLFNRELWFQSKRSDTALTVTGNLTKMVNDGTMYDYADHDQPIAWKFGPQWEDAGEPSVFKLVTRMKIYSLAREVLQANFSMSIRTEVDYNYGITHSNFTATFGSSGSSGYGYNAWGSSPWGSPVTASRVYKLRVGKLRSLRFVFAHSTIHQKVSLSGWEYEVVTAYRKEMKS